VRRYLWLIIGIVLCLVVAIGAYFWATGLLDTTFAYRSPLKDAPPPPGEPLGRPLTRRVVFVLIDALRIDTSLKSDVMPTLDSLRRQGAWATMHSRPSSYSEPGYTVLLTGAWPDLSDGPVINLDYEVIPTFTQDNLFSAVSRLGLSTAVSGYYWFEKLIPQSAVTTSFYTPGEDQFADLAVVDAALPWLKENYYSLILIHLDQVDYAGHHEGGPQDPAWDAAAHRTDNLLGEIVATLDLTRDTLLVVSDHGQIDRGGHGGQESITLQEPFVLVGATVKPGEYGTVDMVDVAPTLAFLLGANIPASSQGHIRTDMLDLSAEQMVAVRSALAAQQAQLVEAYQQAIDHQVPVEQAEDIVAASQRAMDASRRQRLNAERLPRGILALVVSLIPAGILYWKRSRVVAWLLGGAVLYLVIFNGKYALLDKRTYSLSSVESPESLILYCALTVLIALAICWLVTMLGSRSFLLNPRKAAEISLGLTLVILYLLSLPVLLSYALNGIVVTWTLPDFAALFLAFIALIQGLLVALLGIVFAGLSALVAVYARR
jgi:hypothetical protein